VVKAVSAEEKKPESKSSTTSIISFIIFSVSISAGYYTIVALFWQTRRLMRGLYPDLRPLAFSQDGTVLAIA
jgi:hypothetical protein